jgi:hypothetical protein
MLRDIQMLKQTYRLEDLGLRVKGPPFLAKRSGSSRTVVMSCHPKGLALALDYSTKKNKDLVRFDLNALTPDSIRLKHTVLIGGLRMLERKSCESFGKLAPTQTP